MPCCEVLLRCIVTYSKLHALCTRRSQFSTNNDLTSLRSTLHDKSQNTIASSPHGQSIEQLVPQTLTLSDCTETTILHLRCIERNAVLGEVEAFLNQRRQLADAAPLLAQDFLCVRRADDDIGDGGGDADFDPGVAFFCEFALEKFVQFCVEDAVRDELPALGTVGVVRMFLDDRETK